jgi:type IV secretory pathway TraG/TraD family ATPase VirD4
MKSSLELGRRVFRQWILGERVRTVPFRSVIVIGPTQSGKTSRIVIPSILDWDGPVVVTSVKNDVVGVTRPWRERCGPVLLVDPSSASGATWNPLEDVSSFRDALHVMRELFASPPGTTAESLFWNTHASKLVAALVTVARDSDRSIFDVVQWLESHLHAVPRSEDDGVQRVLDGFMSMEHKTFDGVVATALAVLEPWTLPQPLGDVRSVLRSGGTIYFCAPRLDHRRYESLFRGAIRALVDEQERLARHGEAAPLLLVLDEAASIAPLNDLDQMAATLSGSQVTLVSVFQDAAQIQHRWASAARTLVNNHVYRVVFHGTVDATMCDLLPELVPDTASISALRQQRPGSARLLALNMPPMTIRSRPWFRSRLRRRVPSG